MKKPCLLAFALLISTVVQSQDTIRLTVCTNFWKNGEPITGATIYGGNQSQFMQFDLDGTQHCAEFEFISSEFGVDTIITFYADYEDEILRGIDMLDVLKLSKHILGIEMLPTFGMLAGDVNKSNSLTTFDIVELQKLIIGFYQEFPQQSQWRFLLITFTQT